VKGKSSDSVGRRGIEDGPGDLKGGRKRKGREVWDTYGEGRDRGKSRGSRGKNSAVHGCLEALKGDFGWKRGGRRRKRERKRERRCGRN